MINSSLRGETDASQQPPTISQRERIRHHGFADTINRRSRYGHDASHQRMRPRRVQIA